MSSNLTGEEVNTQTTAAAGPPKFPCIWPPCRTMARKTGNWSTGSSDFQLQPAPTVTECRARLGTSHTPHRVRTRAHCMHLPRHRRFSQPPCSLSLSHCGVTLLPGGDFTLCYSADPVLRCLHQAPQDPWWR